jgi:uncharacterized protein YcfJ
MPNFIKDNIYKYQTGGILTDEQKENVATNVGGYGDIATDIFASATTAKDAKKSFEADRDDSIEVTKEVKDEIKSDFMDARQARGEAIGAGAGAAIGAVFGMPGVGAKAGKFIGGAVSKLKGKKAKKKIADKIEEETSENLAYQGMQQSVSARASIAEDAMKQDAAYLQQIGVGKYGGKFNGMVYGPRHEEGGVMMYKDGSPIAEVEGDEYVINNDILKDKKESKKKYQIEGTPVQIASALNSIKKYGVNSHPGGKVKQVS